MRTALGLILLSRVVMAQATLVGTCAAGSTSAGTTSNTFAHQINTAGATLLVASVSIYGSSACSGSMTDSKSNNWHCIAHYDTGGNLSQAIWYAYDSGSGASLVVGSGHYAQYQNSGTYPGMTFTAFGNTITGADPLRSHNGATGSGTTQTTGSISPFAYDLVVSGVEVGGSSGSGFSIDAPLTTGCSEPLIGGQVGAGIGYQLSASSGTQTQTWSNLAGGNTAASIAVFKTVSVSCAITASSLQAAFLGVPYSQTISSNAGCPSPNWTVSTGLLPAGLTLHADTGVIDGTPNGPGGLSSFTAAVSSTNGGDTRALSINVQTPAPVISAVSATGNSPSSLLVQWTTDLPGSSQVQCGTTPGGPYPYVSALVCTGSGGSGICGVGGYADGVTAHAKVISQLPNPGTTYYCTPLSAAPGGGASTGAEVTAATLPAMTSTTPAIQFTGVTRYNDQYNGANGMPDLGIACNGDTHYTMWGASAVFHTLGDSAGCAGAHGPYPLFGTGRHLSIFSGPLRSLSQINLMDAFGNVGQANDNGWTDNHGWTNAKGLSFYGSLVLPVCRWDGDRSGGNCSLIRSDDNGATWHSPVDGTNPPQANHSMWGGFAAGTRCDFQLFPQHAQDYQTNFVNYGNADEFVYGVCSNGSTGAPIAFRVAKEDLLSLDVSKYQYYTGGNGLLAAAWSNDINAAVTLNLCSSSYLGATGAGIEFVPDFNGYLAACPYSTVQWASYIWGPYTDIAVPLRSQKYLNYIPSFPNPVASSYRKLSANPLSAAMVLLAVGNTRGARNNSPADDEYSPHWREMLLTPGPGALVPDRTQVSWEGSQLSHIANGLDCFLDFQPHSVGDFTSGILPDRAPGGLCGAAAAPIYDEHGMYNFGLWTGLVDPGTCDPACVHPQPYTLTTPYTRANTAFTLAIVFAHYPNSLAIVANECVLDKGDISICRNGTAANSWTAKVGAATTSAFALPTDVPPGGSTWPVLFLRWDGANITVMDSTGASVPIVTRATGAWSGTLGSAALTLGSLIGGTQPFYGTLAELLLWNRALSDSEMAQEVGAVRSDMTQRGLGLP